MYIYKNPHEFDKDEKELQLTSLVSSEIKKQLRAYSAEFASEEENCVVVLNNNETLGDLYSDFPELQKIRPENSSSYDNYINQVYSESGKSVSVFLPIEPPAPWRQCY